MMTRGEKDERRMRDETGRTFSRAHSPFSQPPEVESHYSPYVSPPVFVPFSSFFFAALSRVRPPSLNSPSPPSSSSLSRTRASVRNLPRDYSLASIPIQPEYSPGDTVFLDIFLRPTATRKCGACFSSRHVVLAHDDRTLSPRIYVAKHASRELSMMKFENGTIPFSFIHLHCHHRQYIL